MDTKETMLKTAKAMKKTVAILNRCKTPDKVRKGLIKVADIMSEVDDTLAISIQNGLKPPALDDDQVMQLRQGFLDDFPKQAEFLRNSAKNI